MRVSLVLCLHHEVLVELLRAQPNESDLELLHHELRITCLASATDRLHGHVLLVASSIVTTAATNTTDTYSNFDQTYRDDLTLL
jgi:hypothetical protein